MKDRIVDAVWRGKDPFAGFPTNLYEHDTQGWFSGHPYLTDEILKPGAAADDRPRSL